MRALARCEHAITGAGQNAHLDHLHRALDGAFVLGLAHPRREDGDAVVATEIGVHRAQRRLVAVGLGDQRLGIVRHRDLRHAAIGHERAVLTIEPACRGLVGIGVREDRIRVIQRGGEDLRVADAVAVAIAQRQSGEVEVGPLAGNVVMPIGQVAIGEMRRELVAEHAVANAVVVALTVLRPQQPAGHALACELLGHLGVVRSRAALGGALVRGAAVQPTLEFLVAQVGIERPGQAGRNEPFEHALHGGAHHAQTARDEALAESFVEMQTQ